MHAAENVDSEDIVKEHQENFGDADEEPSIDINDVIDWKSLQTNWKFKNFYEGMLKGNETTLKTCEEELQSLNHCFTANESEYDDSCTLDALKASSCVAQNTLPQLYGLAVKHAQTYPNSESAQAAPARMATSFLPVAISYSYINNLSPKAKAKIAQCDPNDETATVYLNAVTEDTKKQLTCLMSSLWPVIFLRYRGCLYRKKIDALTNDETEEEKEEGEESLEICDIAGRDLALRWGALTRARRKEKNLPIEVKESEDNDLLFKNNDLLEILKKRH